MYLTIHTDRSARELLQVHEFPTDEDRIEVFLTVSSNGYPETPNRRKSTCM